MTEEHSKDGQMVWTEEKKEKCGERQDSLFHLCSNSLGELAPATHADLVCVLQRSEAKLCKSMNICIHETGRERKRRRGNERGSMCG